jgi:DNA polymerase (family 10)
MNSKEIAAIFREIAQMLELKGANVFRIRAYERAAQNIENLGDELKGLAEKDQLQKLPGIGADLAAKIKEYCATGGLTYYRELKKDIPEGLIQMLRIPGLGPKTVKLFYERLKIDSIEKLEEAAGKGRLRQVEGIRQKTEENILRGIELLRAGSQRTPLYSALKIAEDFLKEIRKIKAVAKIEVAGSLRRRKETVRDIDILVISKNPSLVMERFTDLPLVSEVLAKGITKSSVIAVQNNIQVDLRVVEARSFGSALLYFTGSKAFNIKLRQLGVRRGYKINEYGVFASGGSGKDKAIAGGTEKEIFSLMKMAYIPPELREDRGELEAAASDSLPRLVALDDIKGDFHVHSNFSDGKDSIEEIAKAAAKCRYEYIGITDHSQSLRIAGGVSIKDLRRKIDAVRKLNKKLKGIRVLCGAEVDILKDGKLDYPDSILKELDFVIAAIHSGFRQSRQQLTERIIRACKNRYVNIIAHPTGVLSGVRGPYELDWEKVYEAARSHRVSLEINCHPQRMDLNDTMTMRAKQAGLGLCLGTDSHSIEQLEFMELGLCIARRGWLSKKDLINCFGLNELLKWLKK